MRNIKTIGLFIEGIIVPLISELFIEEDIVFFQNDNPNKLLEIKKLEKKLYQGSLIYDHFLVKINEIINDNIFIKRLEEANQIDIKCDREVQMLLSRLNKNYSIILFSALPMEIHKKFRYLTDVSTQSFLENILCLNTDNSLTLDNIKTLSTKNNLEVSELLIIDYDVLRGMQLIREGYNVNIYVNSQKLERDLYLWDVIDMHSERSS